jgi:hypothetical protein
MFDGKITNGVLPKDLRWAESAFVIMSGSTPCGHALLHVPPYYFHFIGPSRFNYPKMLTEAEFKTYLAARGKHIVGIYQLPIPFIKLAEAELSKLLKNIWETHLIEHNCATFVKQVAYAGGNRMNLIEWCPSKNLNPMDKLIEDWMKEQMK